VARAPDVVYLYNLVTLIPAARAIRRRHGCPIVLDVQDLWPESILNSGLLGRIPGTARLSAWCNGAYRDADALTVLSPGFRDNLAARGVPPARIDVIHNWCDEASLRPAAPAPDFRERAGFQGHFNVLFAGTMGTAQALDAVIDAARRLATGMPRLRITFLGGGVDVPRLKQVAAGLSNVQFLPPCPPAEAGVYLAAADILLVHLKADPLSAITIPSKIQAYLHAGKPLLGAVAGDAADLVRRAGAGLVCEPGNAAQIAARLLELAQLPADTLRAMGARGRAFYQAELQFNKGVDRFEQVFARAAGKRATP
jgi:glycosyltransferase involved in cell wall biosynthesis